MRCLPTVKLVTVSSKIDHCHDYCFSFIIQGTSNSELYYGRLSDLNFFVAVFAFFLLSCLFLGIYFATWEILRR